MKKLTREAFEAGKTFSIPGIASQKYSYQKPASLHEYGKILLNNVHNHCVVLKIRNDGFTIYATILGHGLQGNVLFDNCIIDT